MSPKLWPV